MTEVWDWGDRDMQAHNPGRGCVFCALAATAVWAVLLAVLTALLLR